MERVLELTAHQQFVAILMALALFVFVFELVRRRKLGEHYSWVWILAALAVVLLLVIPGALTLVTWLIGAAEPSTAVFILGIMFLVVANIFLCSQLTRATAQINRLAQNVALLTAQASPGHTSGDGEQDAP